MFTDQGLKLTKGPGWLAVKLNILVGDVIKDAASATARLPMAG